MIDPINAVPELTLDHAGILELREKLVRYALGRLRSVAGNAPFARLHAEDLASDAIVVALEILDGRPNGRTWPPTVSALKFCRGVISSKISNTCTSAETRTSVDCEGDYERHAPTIGALQEDGTIYGQLYSMLREASQNDVEVLAILQTIVAGGWVSREDYAIENRMPVPRVNSAWKRIQRRAAKIVGDSND